MHIVDCYRDFPLLPACCRNPLVFISRQNVQTLSNSSSLDHFGLDACRLAHKSLIDLVIVKRELEQDDEQIQYYPLAVICPLEEHFTDLQMTLHRNTALRDAVVCSIAHVIRHKPDAAREWKRKEEVRRKETLKTEQLKNAAIILHLEQDKAQPTGAELRPKINSKRAKGRIH
jgi:hypothetical protein